jgi:hypothetical protein
MPRRFPFSSVKLTPDPWLVADIDALALPGFVFAVTSAPPFGVETSTSPDLPPIVSAGRPSLFDRAAIESCDLLSKNTNALCSSATIFASMPLPFSEMNIRLLTKLPNPLLSRITSIGLRLTPIPKARRGSFGEGINRPDTPFDAVPSVSWDLPWLSSIPICLARRSSTKKLRLLIYI